MRVGTNTSKEARIPESDIQHHVVIPLYIPHTTAYYKEAWDVFLLCLESLHHNSYYQFNLSVVSNGCCTEINEKLFTLYQEKRITNLVIVKDSIGKLNSILKVLRTVEEAYITITDADVLFAKNWDLEVFNVFTSFPKAAVVSPVPVFRNQLSYTANIWIDYLFSKKLAFRPVKNPDALEKFAQSIGWNSLEPRFKDVIVTLEAPNKTLAVVSAPHFVATYDKRYLKDIPKENSNFKLGGNSEGKYLDIPPFVLDGYRLATYDNFAYHMGNSIQNWYKEHLIHNDINHKNQLFLKPRGKVSKKFIKSIFQKILLLAIKNRSFYNKLIIYKGYPKEKIKQFWY